MKKCAKCCEVRDASMFCKALKSSDGLQSYCKVCHAGISRVWRKAHRESCNRTNKAWKEKNPERSAELKKRYAETHVLMENIRKSVWYDNNREKHKASVKLWRTKNMDICRAYQLIRRATMKSLGELDKFVVQEAVRLCKLRDISTDIIWEVDHIIPLSIGGSSEHTNIQVVPASWNRRKSNKHSELFFHTNRSSK